MSAVTALAAGLTRQCPCCGGENVFYWRLASSSDPEIGGRSWYTLDRCRDCGTAAVAQQGETNGLYSNGSYRRTPSGRDRLLEPARRLFRRERLRALRPLPARARVFEVGAGDGRFLAALARAGYLTEGVEPYRTVVATEGRVRRDGLETAAVTPSSQDAVVLWHVLEHLPDPEGALRRVREWIAPDGVLVVALPNLASLQAGLGGDRWFHLDVPRHRTHFTERGILALLQRCGYRVVKVHRLLLEQNLVGMWQTLLNWVTPERNVLLRLAKGDRLDVLSYVLLALLGLPLLVAAAILELYAQLRGRGGSVVVRAERAETA